MMELKYRDGLGRTCIFHTRKGSITTPGLLPVINPGRQAIPPAEMKKLFGTEIIITNSYIIYRNEKLKEKALELGLHKMLDFDGPIMTDSGTFQWYTYGDIHITNSEVVEFQEKIGSDIGTILDIFSTPDRTYDEAASDVEGTVKRAREASTIPHTNLLSTPVQGSVYPDLREKCARSLASIGDFFPVGGVVPLMEQYRFVELVQIMLSAKKGLPASAPVHLFGAGHPMMFALAASCGMDLFDSSSYIKYAMDGRFMFTHGTEHLANLEDIWCNCPACRTVTPKELRKMQKPDRIRHIAEHNLYESFSEIRRVREAIRSQKLFDLVEERMRSSPYMYGVLEELYSHDEYLAKYEPRSRKSAFIPHYETSFKRPGIKAFRKSVQANWKPWKGNAMAFDEPSKPYREHMTDETLAVLADSDIVFKTPLGPIPLGLGSTWPVAQSVCHEQLADKLSHGQDTEEEMSAIMEKAHSGNADITIPDIIYDGFVPGTCEKDIMYRSYLAILDHQFGEDIRKVFSSGHLRFVVSKNTGKLRNIYLDGNHILSLRAEDSLFTLKMAGAVIMAETKTGPWVKVNDDSAEFNRMGRNVFAQFVLDADENLRPYDEVTVIGPSGEAVACGRTLMTRSEILDFDKGVAIDIREGINKLKKDE